jgi:hypothetical protein
MCDNAPDALPLGRETGFAKVRKHLVAEGISILDVPQFQLRFGVGTPRKKTQRVLGFLRHGRHARRLNWQDAPTAFRPSQFLHAPRGQAAHTVTRV